MQEVHIKEPGWYGDRSRMYVGIARFRILDKCGVVRRGKIRIWIDYKVNDPTSPTGWKLAYPYPFDIKCTEVINYQTQVLYDYKHTILHIIPMADLKEVKNYRSGSPRGRTMPQEEFKKIMAFTEAVKRQDAINGIR